MDSIVSRVLVRNIQLSIINAVERTRNEKRMHQNAILAALMVNCVSLENAELIQVTLFIFVSPIDNCTYRLSP